MLRLQRNRVATFQQESIKPKENTHSKLIAKIWTEEKVVKLKFPVQHIFNVLVEESTVCTCGSTLPTQEFREHLQDSRMDAKAEILERRLSAKPPDDLDLISHELFTKLHACPPPSIAKSSNQKFGKNEALRSSTFSTMNTWKIRTL